MGQSVKEGKLRYSDDIRLEYTANYEISRNKQTQRPQRVKKDRIQGEMTNIYEHVNRALRDVGRRTWNVERGTQRWNVDCARAKPQRGCFEGTSVNTLVDFLFFFRKKNQDASHPCCVSIYVDSCPKTESRLSL